MTAHARRAAARDVGRHRVHRQPRRRSLVRSARAVRPRLRVLDDLDRFAALGIQRPALSGAVGTPRAAQPRRHRLALDRRAPRAAARPRHPADRRAAASWQRAGATRRCSTRRFPTSSRASRGAVARALSVGHRLHAGQRAADDRPLQRRSTATGIRTAAATATSSARCSTRRARRRPGDAGDSRSHPAAPG